MALRSRGAEAYGFPAENGFHDDRKKTSDNIYKLSDHDLEMVSAGTDQDNTGGNTGEISKYGSTCPDCKDSTKQTQLPSGQWLCGNCQLIY